MVTLNFSIKLKEGCLATASKTRLRIYEKLVAEGVDHRVAADKAGLTKETSPVPIVDMALRGRELKRAYGITLDDYDELNTRQEGLCAICLFPPKPGKHLSVDHNHGTKVVRGLLCGDCNRALGQLGDNPIIVQRAVDYLKERGFYPTR